MSDCFVCAKHGRLSAAVPGGAVLGDEHVVVAHLPLRLPDRLQPDAYLGHLLVEPRRHIEQLGDLTRGEAASFGRFAARASAALRSELRAEHVYAAVIGHDVDHLHLHLIPRYPGTPREFWWTRLDEWPDAPRGDAHAIADLTRRLRQAAQP